MRKSLSFLAAVALTANTANAQTIDRRQLTLGAAQQIARAAEQHARLLKVDVTVAVVDAGGVPILLHRMEGAVTGAVPMALSKARTAASWRVPTSQLESGLVSGGTRLLSIPDAVLIAGGLPIVVGVDDVGAVGVSGGSSEQDEAIARAALTSLTRTP